MDEFGENHSSGGQRQRGAPHSPEVEQERGVGARGQERARRMLVRSAGWASTRARSLDFVSGARGSLGRA